MTQILALLKFPKAGAPVHSPVRVNGAWEPETTVA